MTRIGAASLSHTTKADIRANLSQLRSFPFPSPPSCPVLFSFYSFPTVSSFSSLCCFFFRVCVRFAIFYIYIGIFFWGGRERERDGDKMEKDNVLSQGRGGGWRRKEGGKSHPLLLLCSFTLFAVWGSLFVVWGGGGGVCFTISSSIDSKVFAKNPSDAYTFLNGGFYFLYLCGCPGPGIQKCDGKREIVFKKKQMDSVQLGGEEVYKVLLHLQSSPLARLWRKGACEPLSEQAWLLEVRGRYPFVGG